MPDGTLPIVTGPALDAAIKSALGAVPINKKLQATAGITKAGVELSVGVKPKSWLSLGGYAAKLWGGGWDAGAKAQIIW